MTRESMMELRCSRELALRLGAIEPLNVGDYNRLRASHLLVRDPVTLRPMFWLWMSRPPEMLSREGG